MTRGMGGSLITRGYGWLGEVVKVFKHVVELMSPVNLFVEAESVLWNKK
jgi:hypothetical protein